MLAGTGIVQVSTFIAMLIAARLLGSIVFGRFGIIQSTLAMLGLFAGFGMGLTNKRYVGELRDQDPIRCGQAIAFSMVVTLFSAGILATALFTTAPWITTTILKAPDLVLELRIAAAILLLNGLNESQVGALSGLEDFRRITKVNVLRAIITPIFVIGGVWLWRLPGLLVGVALAALFVWTFTQKLLNESVRDAGIAIRFDHVRHEGEILWHFTLPAIASGVLPAVVFWAVRAILVQYPEGYAQLGIYTAAEHWLSILAFVPGQISNVSLPILSNVYATKDRVRFRKAILGNIALPVCIAFVIALPLIVGANSITVLYGETFNGLSSVLVLMCLVGVLRVWGGAIGTLLVTINRMWVSFGVNTIWGIILIVITIMLAAQGALGLAYANLIAYSVHAFLGLSVFYWYEIRPRH